MAFNWKAIDSYEDAEVALYRLLGEMLRRKATLPDLDRIRSFLLNADLVSDGWEGLGEALHRTTTGSPEGYEIWHAWLGSFDDVEVEEDRLASKWASFGQEISEVEEVRAATPPEFFGESDPNTIDDIPSIADDDDTSAMSQPLAVRRVHTGVLSESATQLLQMVPDGPFTIQVFGTVYHLVDKYTMLTLLKRGLFAGAHIAMDGQWIAAWQHPAFTSIGMRMRAEAERILTREDDEPDAQTDQLQR